MMSYRNSNVPVYAQVNKTKPSQLDATVDEQTDKTVMEVGYVEHNLTYKHLPVYGVDYENDK